MVAKVRESKKLVTVAIVRDAVVALSERNGSNVKSIFNYLVWKRQVNSGARKQVVLAIGKAVKAGVLVKRGKMFVVSAKKSAKRAGKGKVKRAKKANGKKASKKSRGSRRRRGQKKRKSLKKKARKSAKKTQRSSKKVARKPAKSRKPVKARKGKANRKPKSANYAKPAPVKMSTRPQRRCTIGVHYTA